MYPQAGGESEAESAVADLKLDRHILQEMVRKEVYSLAHAAPAPEWVGRPTV
jgi:hypothetical protein